MIDVNDESPKFQFNVYKGQIDENLPQASRVLEVKATDGDDQDMVNIPRVELGRCQKPKRNQFNHCVA